MARFPAVKAVPVSKRPVLTLTGRSTHAIWWSTLEIASRYGVQFAVTVALARLLQKSGHDLPAHVLLHLAQCLAPAAR